MNEVYKEQNLNLDENGLAQDPQTIEFCQGMYNKAYKYTVGQLTKIGLRFRLEGSYSEGTVRYGLLPTNLTWIDVANLQVLNRRSHEEGSRPDNPSDIDIIIEEDQTPQLIDQTHKIMKYVLEEYRVFVQFRFN